MRITIVIKLYKTEQRYYHEMVVNYHNKKIDNIGPRRYMGVCRMQAVVNNVIAIVQAKLLAANLEKLFNKKLLSNFSRSFWNRGTLSRVWSKCFNLDFWCQELGKILTLLIVIKCKDIVEVCRPYLKGNISFLSQSFE